MRIPRFHSYTARPRSLMGGGRFGRQLSLEGGGKQATTANEKREFLRRQASEDFRPLKIAWANETDQPGVEVVAKKCGQPKPTPTKPPRSPFAPDQKTVLFSRQQLTQSLRSSWQKNSAGGRHNLNIFINQSLDSENESISEPNDSRSPVRSSSSEADPQDEVRPNYELTSPTPPPTLSASDRRLNFRNLGRQKVVDVQTPVRPIATSPPPPTPLHHAPLTRMMSAPSGKSANRKSTPRLVKTPSLETRVKSAPSKRKPKTPAKRKPKDAAEEDKSERRVRRGVDRGEVVTMVSLVSPAESEEDDDEDATAAAAAASIDALNSLSDTPTPEPMKPNPPPPVITFGKPHKVVTFRPTAIIQSPVTQYQTNFPLKRTGTSSPSGHATPKSPGLLRQSTLTGSKPSQIETVSSPPNKKPGVVQRQTSLASNFVFKKHGGEPHETVSNQETKSDSQKLPTIHNSGKKPQAFSTGARRKILQSTPTVIKIEPLPVKEVELEQQASASVASVNRPSSGSTTVESKMDAVDFNPPEKDDKCPLDEIKTTKELECWQLFKKMSSKGVTVSFDTVCRGLLTPTEYRMRRSALVTTC